MFSMPVINAVPIPSLLGGTVMVPGMGAFLAAVLLAALIGSGLGLLRELTSPHDDVPAQRPATAPPAFDGHDHHLHQAA